MKRKSFLAPEILQITSMDCGVAAVSCMLSAFGIDANYEKLRELCQTSVDGTSINALEDLCVDLGLDVCQHIVPKDLIVDAMQGRMPLIAVEAPAVGRLHFVVVWSQVGNRLQIMDPRAGRTWSDLDSFGKLLVVHRQQMSPEEWSEWFPSSSFREALERSARSLLSRGMYERMWGPAVEGADGRLVGAFDAALRLVRKTCEVSGSKSQSWRDTLFESAFNAGLQNDLPDPMWSVRASPDGQTVRVEGAVLLGVTSPDTERGAIQPTQRTIDLGNRVKSSLLKNVMNVLGKEARPFIGWIIVAIAATSIASAIEVLLYRTALDIPRLITTPETRIGASLALLCLFATLLGLESSIAFGVNRLGRALELKLRMKTLWAVPRVDDDFVKSRPTSDLAYRAQALSMGALLIPTLAGAAGGAADLAVTLLAIGLLDPRYAVIVLVGSVLFVASWLLARSKLTEIDTRLQVHASRLTSILLDGLRGIRPIRLHGYQDAFRDDQMQEIQHWKTTAFAQVDVTSALQARYTLLGVLILSSIFVLFVHRHGDPRQFVVLAFWSFRIPPIITRFIQFAQRFPLVRNAVDRLLEVTQYALTVGDDEMPPPENRQGVAIEIRDVSVVLGGHSVLEDIKIDIPAGQHVAIVGASGSGKSTIVALLLGLHEPTTGEIRIDGAPFDRNIRQSLRAQTMWIDPAIQLWNDSLGANLDYACRGYPRRPALEVLESSDLLGVLASVERGLDAPLGAEGAFVSGGEGQRIRVGRGLFRADTRLALLDEPFRGLDRTTRHQILMSIRRAAIRATMVFVSHDISHAMSFERVLVVDGGRIIEDGAPQELCTQDSVFARLLNAEKELLASAWSGNRWRRIRVEGGVVREVEDRG